MQLFKTWEFALWAATVTNALPQIGLPRPQTTTSDNREIVTVDTELVPVVKTIFRDRPSSLPADLKTTSAIVDGSPCAVLVPTSLPQPSATQMGEQGKTLTKVMQTITAWIADPTSHVTQQISQASMPVQVTIPPIVHPDASIPILSGTHSIGMTSLGAHATTLVQSAIASATTSLAAAPSKDHAVPQLNTCGTDGKEYTDGDKITSGNNTYTVHCAQDNSQASYAMQYVASGGFDACPTACDSTPGCMGFTFLGDDSGFCYLKDAEGTYSPAVMVITSAFKKSATPGEVPSPSSGGSSNGGSSTPTPSSGTGESCSSLGKSYVDSKKQNYTVACKTDLPGNDIGVVQASSFSDCFDECAKKNGCVAFSFLGGGGAGPCYLKSNAVKSSSNPNNADSAYLPNAGEAASPTSSASNQNGPAAPTATTAGSCEALSKGSGPSQFTDEYGSLYNITCKKDIAGGNLKTVTAPTFQDCFAQCDGTIKCVGFSWFGGYCYLKSFQQNSISDSPADVAVKVKIGPNVPSGGVGDHSASITILQPSATAAPSTPAGPSCKQLPSQVGLYKVKCGYDANGGDLGLGQANSFSGCVPLCDAMPKCIGFAYVGGSSSGICYFKQVHEPEGANSNVDIAFKPSVGEGGLSSGAVPTAVMTSAMMAPDGKITSAVTVTDKVPTSLLSAPTGLITETIKGPDGKGTLTMTTSLGGGSFIQFTQGASSSETGARQSTSASAKGSSSAAASFPSSSNSASTTGKQETAASTKESTTLKQETKSSSSSTSKEEEPVFTITGEATTITKTAALTSSTAAGSFITTSAKATSSKEILPDTSAWTTVTVKPSSKETHTSSVEKVTVSVTLSASNENKETSIRKETTIIKPSTSAEREITVTATPQVTKSSHTTAPGTTFMVWPFTSNDEGVKTPIATSKAPEKTSKKEKGDKKTKTKTKGKPATATSSGDLVQLTPIPHVSPSLPVVNPAVPIPTGLPEGSSCKGLLEKDGFRLRTEVIRGEPSLGHCYVASSLGDQATSPLTPGGGSTPAMIERTAVNAASFTWAENGVLAMVNNIESVEQCLHPGLSLLQPAWGVGAGEVSFTPTWGTEGANAAGNHGGIEYDLNGRHEFGGWKVCRGEQQLLWMLPTDYLDEGRCAEVTLVREKVPAPWLPSMPGLPVPIQQEWE